MPRPRRRGNREKNQFVDQMMYLLTAPFITWPGQEGIYELTDNRTTAKLERLVHQKEIFENQEATEFEAMLYISTVTLERPIGHDWTEIYMYLFKRWSPEKAAAADIAGPDELNKYPQQDDLVRLRKLVFMRQMNHIKRKLGINQAVVETEAQELKEEQQRLF